MLAATIAMYSSIRSLLPVFDHLIDAWPNDNCALKTKQPIKNQMPRDITNKKGFSIEWYDDKPWTEKRHGNARDNF